MSTAIPEHTPLSTSSSSSLEPYAQLLRAILPRMDSLCVFNPSGRLHWSSEMSVPPEVAREVDEALRGGAVQPGSPGALRSVGGEPLYLFWLPGEDTAGAAASFRVVAIALKPTPGSEPRSFAFVHGLVRPALECLRRELLAQNEIIALQSSLIDQDGDLDMLLSVSGGGAQANPESAVELKDIVASATEHLKAGLAALIIPDRGIAVIESAREAALDTSLLAKAHRHLLSMAQVRRGATLVNRLTLPTPAGEVLCRVLACPIARADSSCVGVLALFRDSSAPEFTAHHARLVELLARRIAVVLAHSYDALTGLLSRTAFEQRVRRALADGDAASSPASGPWSALYIDINRLHVVNDNYGMPMGDRVIGGVGELIRKRLPPGSSAARISGDRFAILLPADVDHAAKFAEALRSGAEQIGHSIGDGRMQVSISIGVAPIEEQCRDFVRAFAAAETSCKAANDRGRNRIEVYQEADASIVRRFTDVNLISELRDAIEENRLQLNAQLIAPLGGHGGAPHFEILLRLIGENGEVVGPDHFMSAALRYQLMPTLDRWVIGRSIEMLKPHAELLRTSPVVFSINFSGQSLQDEGFGEHVTQLVENSGLAPSALCFELTESAAIGNLQRAEELMRRLRRIGCNIALDDFGTGLSSLAYLRSLPIGMLKIDGSFVRDVLKDPRAESMVQTIAQLARAMALTTVAEYVETEEIRSRIQALGVDYGQGFAIAQPAPLAEVLNELPLYAAVPSAAGAWPRHAAPVGVSDVA